MLAKKVNIYPTMPITTLNPVIRTMTKNTIKTVDEIKQCINARARVEEILIDGSILVLNLSNYDKNNNKKCIVNNAIKPSEEPYKVENASEEIKETKPSEDDKKVVNEPTKEDNKKEVEHDTDPHSNFEEEEYECDEPTDEEVEFSLDDEKGL